MAQYNVTNQIKEIAKIKNTTIEAIAKKLELDYDDNKVFAWNRREESQANKALSDAKQAIEDAKAETIRQEAKSNFHWRKENFEWVVAGDFSQKKIGDEIEVYKVNGEKQIKVIVDFTKTGSARVANK